MKYMIIKTTRTQPLFVVCDVDKGAADSKNWLFRGTFADCYAYVKCKQENIYTNA